VTRRVLELAALLVAGVASHLPAQASDLARERSDYATWLAAAPLSPYAAVAVQPIGTGLVLGPAEADIPLQGVTRARVLEERGTVSLDDGKQRRTLQRGASVTLGGYRLLITGAAGRTQLVVYGAPRTPHPPLYYPAQPPLSFTASLEPPERRGVFRTLGSDGLETEATEAGFVTLPLPSGPARLRVYRMGSPDDDEAELQIFFRDSTNNRGTYPAGRFVTLDPVGNERYRIDLNRARNPFCAYNTVFPCPAPWPGNSIAAAVTAGERYEPK
jgi:uncharacterized protein